ncbi:hypothetical protein GCM10010486_81970 [Nonomuraea roseoviolacea subsp. carminata]
MLDQVNAHDAWEADTSVVAQADEKTRMPTPAMAAVAILCMMHETRRTSRKFPHAMTMAEGGSADLNSVQALGRLSGITVANHCDVIDPLCERGSGRRAFDIGLATA